MCFVDLVHQNVYFFILNFPNGCQIVVASNKLSTNYGLPIVFNNLVKNLIFKTSQCLINSKLSWYIIFKIGQVHVLHKGFRLLELVDTMANFLDLLRPLN